jgi:2-polyprenyl-6-methoxyphenol hydroxylase-like FAD-dependent oxidoreductase
MARNQMWHYDVAVIGGGIAGLTAATLVARTGKSVIVFEQAEHVGGRGVTQNIQGFHFNLGPHALYRAGHAVRVLKELGITIPDGKVGTAGSKLVHKTEANCRQMIHRAKEYIASRHRRFDPTREETEHVTTEFLEATENGDLSRLMKLFAPDAVLFSDGGGKVRAALNPIHGPDAIARFAIGAVKKNLPPDAVHAPAEVNGQPAFVTWIGGQRVSVTVLDIRDGLIRHVFIVVNPEKLSRVE